MRIEDAGKRAPTRRLVVGAGAAAAAAGAAGAGAAEVVCGDAGAASSRDGAFAGAGAGCAAFRDDASMLGAPLLEAIGVTRTRSVKDWAEFTRSLPARLWEARTATRKS